MIEKTIARLEHLTCQCKRPAMLVECYNKGELRYKVEAPCCKTSTVTLKTQQRAVNEFQRIRATQAWDAEHEQDAPELVYNKPGQSAGTLQTRH